MGMRRLKVSDGGQVSVPAEVRHRWRTRVVTVEDHGDHLVLRPAPEDPVTAARGALRPHIRSNTRTLRNQARRDEREAEARRA